MKIKFLFLFVLLPILLTTCMKKNQTKEEFAQEVLSRLMLGKDLSDFYIKPEDSIYTADTNLIKRLRKLAHDSLSLASYKNRKKNEAKYWREKAKKLKIKEKNYELMNVEIDSFIDWGDILNLNMVIYFLPYELHPLVDSTQEHYFVLNVDSLKNGWKIYRISKPTNRLEQAKMPYVPFWGLSVTRFSWTYKHRNSQSFETFKVTIKNTTGHDFKRVKFRLTIYDRKKNEKVFSKIIEINEPIYNGDVAVFEVEELRDFYTGFYVRNKNNFDVDAQIVDAKPRPGYEDLPF